MSPSSPEHVTFTEPFLARHPWVAAFLLGTVATPGGIVIGWLAPRPLDAVVALPLVLLDIWAAPAVKTNGSELPLEQPAFVRLLVLALGVALTWLFYVLVARLVLWRLVPRAAGGHLLG